MVQQHKTLKGSSADQNQNALSRSLLKHVLKTCTAKLRYTLRRPIRIEYIPKDPHEIGHIFKFWCALKSAPPSNTTPAIKTDSTSKFFII